jgi:hypothetical protein
LKLLTDAEFDAVVPLDGPGRYAHFLKQVADWGCVWSLCTPEGWVMAQEDNHELVPSGLTSATRQPAPQEPGKVQGQTS